jgi:hypothetical protein
MKRSESVANPRVRHGYAPRKVTSAFAALGLATLVTLAGGGTALARAGHPATRPAAASFANHVFASGAKIVHPTRKGPEAISQPDDITSLHGDIFVGFQNGVGPQDEASPTGNKDSTVVEFGRGGQVIRQWDVVGKCDGLTADPLTGQVIATVNEDAYSSLYLIDPVAGGQAVHYRYDVPLPSRGGTDAVEIYHGMVLISASAPGTTGAAAPRPSYPAVYRTVFDSKTHVATVHPLFFDESSATVANTNDGQEGKQVHLALTDPDSNEDVPSYAHRFAGDFMLTSQGDKEQIFVSGAGTSHQRLSVLKISDSVDDTAWASDSSGAIYTTDNDNNTINKITGPFARGAEYVADTPCDADGAPSSCPGPGFPANFLGQLNPDTGVITHLRVTGPTAAAQGMMFLP